MSDVLSTHKVEVVAVHPEPHANADSLSVVRVYGYSVVVRTADWADGALGAYIPPDSLVDTSRPEFSFLSDGKRPLARIRAKKLRGVQSFGLLIPAPPGASIGDNVADYFGVTHYEPPLPTLQTGGEAEAGAGFLSCLSKYDIDSLRRYTEIFVPGEMVCVTEKIHGANSRYAWVNDRLWCGSRTEWKKESEQSLWWKAAHNTPTIEDFCRDHPNHVLYGEAYGAVQSLTYGCNKGEVRFAAFDVLGPDGMFWDAFPCRDRLAAAHVPQVPLLEYGPFDFEHICSMAEGPSQIPAAKHVREGCVVKPIAERWHQAIGRVTLKVVGAGYLEKS